MQYVLESVLIFFHLINRITSDHWTKEGSVSLPQKKLFMHLLALKIRLWGSKDDPSCTEQTMNAVSEVFFILFFIFLEKIFKIPPFIYFCRVEGSWICLA